MERILLAFAFRPYIGRCNNLVRDRGRRLCLKSIPGKWITEHENRIPGYRKKEGVFSVSLRYKAVVAMV